MGEAVDRHTILQIKADKIKDQQKLSNVRLELEYLNKLIVNDIYFSLISIDDLELLYDINLKLWKVEDRLRELESDQNFGEEFIQLARDVYFTNDKRAEVKKRINLACGARFIEEKSYSDYKKS